MEEKAYVGEGPAVRRSHGAPVRHEVGEDDGLVWELGGDEVEARHVSDRGDKRRRVVDGDRVERRAEGRLEEDVRVMGRGGDTVGRKRGVEGDIRGSEERCDVGRAP